MTTSTAAGTTATTAAAPVLPAQIEIAGDSPEAVALALLREILARDPAQKMDGSALLDLYATCLRVVRHPGSRLDG